MNNLSFRKANFSDVTIYFNWINDAQVRENSFDSNIITWENHVKWFKEKIEDPNYIFYVFQQNNKELIGQVRIQKINEIDSIISVSVSAKHRGAGYGSRILVKACNDYLKKRPNCVINAYIKIENFSSKMIFEKAGFQWFNNLIYKNFNTDHYVLYENRKL